VNYLLKHLLLAAGLLATVGCKKDPTELDRLPEATREGKGTAGFLLDGKAWLPLVSDQTGAPAVNGSWRRTRRGQELTLSFTRTGRQEHGGATFFVPDIRQPGTFSLQQEPDIIRGGPHVAFGEYFSSRPSPGFIYYTGPDAPGELIITRFDTVQNVVSGTFEMSLREDGGSATLSVTHGRFDLHFSR
jgi:hypothetical protein